MDTPGEHTPNINAAGSDLDLLECDNSHCQFCFTTGARKFIDGQHKTECLQWPIPCPDKCGVENIPRQDIDEHRKICVSAVVHCEYHAMGCEYRAARGSMEKHNKENMTQHLSLTRGLLDRTKQEFATTAQNLEKQHTDFVCNTKSVIADLEEKVKQVMMKNDAAEDRIIELEKQLQSLKQKEGGSQSKNCSWLPVSWKDDKNVQALTARAHNDDLIPVLPVYVKMSQFDKYRRSKARWYSDPFYSHKKGYKMCLHVKASGLGASVRDVYVSVLIHLMKGEYDDELPWPITKTFSITLLNQISDEDHWVREACFASVPYKPIAERVTGDREIGIYGRGCFGFIAIKRISKIKPLCQYVKDDSIVFLIEHSPWDTWES